MVEQAHVAALGKHGRPTKEEQEEWNKGGIATFFRNTKPYGDLDGHGPRHSQTVVS